VRAGRRSLVADLRAIGVAAGDAVMIHAALRRIGPIIGGVDMVLAALREAVGAEGTVLAYCDWQGQEEIDAGAPREDVPPFDPQSSRAARENGFFSELLRTTPGALRSDNPGASVAAIGAQAAWFTTEHPLDYGYGPGSPFAKLVSASGKVLMLGAPLDTMTLLHHAEHLARIPKRLVRCDVPLIEDAQLVWRRLEEFDTSDPPGDLPADYMAELVEDFLAAGRGRQRVIGAAPSVLVRAAEIVPFAVDWLEQRYTEERR
jgi:aminoglycoside 3-N-acetyltransferase